MHANKFCPSESDRCREGCETSPLDADYADHWREAYESGDLMPDEERAYLAWLETGMASETPRKDA